MIGCRADAAKKKKEKRCKWMRMRWYLSEGRAGVKEQVMYKQTNEQEFLKLKGKRAQHQGERRRCTKKLHVERTYVFSNHSVPAFG
jgi:hypothetical protein